MARGIGAMDGDDTEANALVNAVLATTREAIILADETDDAPRAEPRSD